MHYFQQRVGLAFFLQMVACACHFVAFLVSLVFVYFVWTSKSDASDRYMDSFNRGSKLNVASVGRSASENISQTIFWAQISYLLGICFWYSMNHSPVTYHLLVLSILKSDLKDRNVSFIEKFKKQKLYAAFQWKKSFYDFSKSICSVYRSFRILPAIY